MSPVGHIVDQGAHAEAADFLVVRKGQLQRQPQRPGRGPVRGPQRTGEKALHVGRAACKQPAAAFLQPERTGGPCLAVGRHDVGMTRQQHAAAIGGADVGVQIGLAAVAVHVQLRLDAARGQKLAHELDQRQVRIAADRWKADQLIQDLNAVHYLFIKA